MRGVPAGVVGLLVMVVWAGCLGGTDGGLDGVPAVGAEVLSVTRVVQVDPVRWSGEPSILALDDGTLLITGVSGFTRYAEDPSDVPARFGQSYVWRSTDGGATWAFVGPPVAAPHPVDAYAFYRNAVLGVEGDLAKDEAGRAYFVDLTMLAANGLSSSTDSGASWTATQNPLVGQPGTDRPWVAAIGDGEVFVKYLQMGGGHRVARSVDAGMTFLEDDEMPACGQADMTVDVPAKRLLVGCSQGDRVFFAATSTGRTLEWMTGDVATAAGPVEGGFVSMAVAATGHYVLAWVESVEGGMRTAVAASVDAGATWSEPVVLSAPNRTAIFPWVDANEAGEVGVVWYEAEAWGDPNALDSLWWVQHARLHLDADGLGAPVVSVVGDRAVHEGSICNAGLGCVLQGRADDRRLLDFFEIDVDYGGTHHVTWTDTNGEVPTVWYGRLDPPPAA